MCEANVYLVREGREELLMEAVDVMEPRGDKLYLRNIFGEQREVAARLKTTSLLQHKILLEPLSEGEET
jgi:predicted RNA-binding protein